MKKKHIHTLTALMMAMLSGCINEETIVPEQGSNVTFSYKTDEYIAASKSILTSEDIEEKMTSVSVFVYYKDRLIQTCHDESADNGVSLELEDGREYDIYALANMGGMTGIMPEDKSSDPIEDVSWTIPSYSKIDADGLPMAGKAEGFKAGTDTPVISFKRLFAKVCADISFSYEGAAVSGIKVMNLNGTLKPFSSSAATSASSIMTDVEYDSGSGGYIFYVPENMQGQIGSATSSHGKNPDLDTGINARKEVLTYMEVDVTLDGSDEYIGTVTYRSYLGNDNNRNFDIKGNCCYNWSVKYHKDNLQFNDWKIVTDAMSPVAKDYLEFTEKVTVGPEQTVDVRFSYDLSASGSDPSVITFTSDDGLEFGTPTFTSDGDHTGSGVIQLTCSPSSAIGDILSIRMETEAAFAETEVIVVNYLKEVILGIPFPYTTSMAQESMSLKATAKYYDGTIITDPSEFIWKITVTSGPEDLVSIDNGVLRRRLDAKGGCRIQAEHGGMKSAYKTIAVKDYYVTAEFVPDPVEIQVDEDINGYVQLYRRSITDPETSNLVQRYYLYNGDYSNRTYKFSVEDESVCSVYDISTSNQLGLNISGLSDGSTRIMLDFYETSLWSSHQLEIPVTTGRYSHALELSESSIYDKTGSSHQLKAYYVTYNKDHEISRTDVTSEAVWHTNSSAIATVTAGLVQSVGKEGKTTISAEYNGYHDYAMVEFVTVSYQYELRISKSTLNMDEGESYQLKAYYDTYMNGKLISTDDVTNEAYWNSSHWRIASVSGGFVEAHEEGDAAITVEYNGLEAWTELTVNYVEGYSETELEIIPSELTVSVGETVRLTAMEYIYNFGQLHLTSNITRIGRWSSSDRSIAPVDAFEGYVTGASAGQATITISYNGYTASIPVTVTD